MPSWFLKVIASSQLIGGTLTIASAWYLWLTPGHVVQPWYFSLLQGLGLAGIVAGWWLWRDDSRGWAISKGYQAVQVLQLQTSTWGFGIVLGLHGTFRFGARGLEFAAGAAGQVNIVIGSGMPWLVGLNLLALLAFVGLVWPRWLDEKVTAVKSAIDEVQAMSNELDNRPGPPSAHRPEG